MAYVSLASVPSIGRIDEDGKIVTNDFEEVRRVFNDIDRDLNIFRDYLCNFGANLVYTIMRQLFLYHVYDCLRTRDSTNEFGTQNSLVRLIGKYGKHDEEDIKPHFDELVLKFRQLDLFKCFVQLYEAQFTEPSDVSKPTRQLSLKGQIAAIIRI